MSRMVQALKQLDDHPAEHAAKTLPAPAAAPDESRAAVETVVRSDQPAATTYEMSLAHGPDDSRLVRQMRRFTDKIVGEFPPDMGGSLFFSGVASGGHVADVAAQLARQLTERRESDVLLIDADAGRKVLSQRFAASAECGLGEALQETLDAGKLVVASAIARLHFLPFGAASLSRRTTPWSAVQSMVADLRRNYRYVIFAGGTTHDVLSEALGRFCDGTYLLVPLGRAERDESSQAARRLTASGARLLGAVVTGVR